MDEAGLLGDSDELVGRNELHVGTLPAHERFEVRRPPRRERDDRLVVRDQLVAIDRAPQRGLEVEPGRDEGLHPFVEELDASPATVLGAVHRGIGVTDELVGALVAAVPDRDTDRRGEHHLVGAEDERRAQHLVEATGAIGDLVDVARLVAEHDELVAAEPGDGVALARSRPQPLGDLDEQGVADVVTEAVVDVLEPVEVEQQQPDDRAPALARRIASSSRSIRSLRLARPVSSS